VAVAPLFRLAPVIVTGDPWDNWFPGPPLAVVFTAKLVAPIVSPPPVRLYAVRSMPV